MVKLKSGRLIMRTYKASRKRPLTSAAQKRGYKSKVNGRDAEELVLVSDIDGMLFKRYEPYRRLTGGKIFKAQATEKAGCDYSVFTAYNAGMIEVKSREADRIALSALDETQHAQLHQLSEMGRIALVLVRLRGEWYCLPYAVFKSPPNGVKSWSISALSTYQVRQVDGVLCLEEHLRRHYDEQ
jgi:hypothetical protein